MDLTELGIFLYVPLFCDVLAVLVLSALRVRHTTRTSGSYEPIVVELLVSAALSVVWIPWMMYYLTLVGERATTHRPVRWLHADRGGFVFFVLWLAGAAVLTRRVRSGSMMPKEGVVTALIATSWAAFGLLVAIAVVSTVFEVVTMRRLMREPPRARRRTRA